MIAALQDMRGRFADTYVVIVLDIDQQPALESQWGDKVPVLLEGDVEICHFFLDADRLARHLANQAQQGASADSTALLR